MHCHGGVRSVGGEQLVDLGDESHPRAADLRAAWYAGRAPANELARRGFVVLVHDTFSWGSRRFDLSQPTPRLAGTLEAYPALCREHGSDPQSGRAVRPGLRVFMRTRIAKAAGTLGQTFAGAVLTDDLVALDVLARTSGSTVTDCRRSASPAEGAAASCWPLSISLLPHIDIHPDPMYLHHSFLTFPVVLLPSPPGLDSSSSTVLMTPSSRRRVMRAAHRHLEAIHPDPGRDRASFTAGGHEFDIAMQDEAMDFLLNANLVDRRIVAAKLTGLSAPDSRWPIDTVGLILYDRGKALTARRERAPSPD